VARLEPVAKELEALSRLSCCQRPASCPGCSVRPLAAVHAPISRSASLLPRLPSGRGSRSHRRSAPFGAHSAPSAGRAGAGRCSPAAVRRNRPLGRSRRRLPARHVRHDLLLEKAVDQLQDAPVADRLAYPCHKPVVRDRIEVTLQSAIDHMGIAFLQQPIDFPQRVFAALARPEAVASRRNWTSKTGSMVIFKSRLHDAILDCRYPSGRVCPPPLGMLTRLTGLGR